MLYLAHVAPTLALFYSITNYLSLIFTNFVNYIVYNLFGDQNQQKFALIQYIFH
jgi:hypothetical protein